MRLITSEQDRNDDDPVIYIDPHSAFAQFLNDNTPSDNPRDDPLEMVIQMERLLIRRTGKNIVQTYTKTKTTVTVS